MLSGIQAQLIGASGLTVAPGANIVFNSLLNDPSPNISYSIATGEFTITAPGNYYVNWWVNTDGAGAASSIIFGLAVSGGPTILASSPAPVVTLQLNGQALITVGAVPVTVSLVNLTGASVVFGTSAIQADLTIIETT